jgi:carbon monoxide dehydrogenase subunit G
MEMTGSYRIAAPRDRVWAALNDPAVLKDCIPGCESLDKLSDTEMQAVASLKIGPVKARFNGKVTLSDIKAPESYTITGEGSGGAAGFAKGGADVSLAEEGPETVLTYTARAQVGGKIAQMGARLIDGVAKKMADDFFAKFRDRVGADANGGGASSGGAAGGATEASGGAATGGSGGGTLSAADAQHAEDERIADEVIAEVAAHPDEIGPAEEPDAPGPVPHPEHRVGVPGAPATNPPEPFAMPSSAAMAGVLGRYGATGALVAIAIVVVAIVVATL